MKPYKEIFEQVGSLPNKPKYETIRKFYQHVFADPEDQDHGLDAMVINSMLKAGVGNVVDIFGTAYKTAYLPMFGYYAKVLVNLIETNGLAGKVAFLERDGGHLADVATLLPELKDKAVKVFWPRSISSGQGINLEDVVDYQRQIFGGVGIIADTGMYGIQTMSLHTGRSCFHYQTTHKYWGGPTNEANIPLPLLNGIFAGTKLLPIFLVSSTHWRSGFQIPGVLNHLVYKHEAEILDWAKGHGIVIETNEVAENFIRQLLSLTLDSIERLLPSSWTNSGKFNSKTKELKVEANNDLVAVAILKRMNQIRQSPFEVSEVAALEAVKNLVGLSITALKTGVFTGVLPIGVPGKYAGNEDAVVDIIPHGGKQSHMEAMNKISMGNSLLYPQGPNQVADLPLPEAEKLAAERLFKDFKWR